MHLWNLMAWLHCCELATASVVSERNLVEPRIVGNILPYFKASFKMLDLYALLQNVHKTLVCFSSHGKLVRTISLWLVWRAKENCGERLSVLSSKTKRYIAVPKHVTLHHQVFSLTEKEILFVFLKQKITF